jgi:hypothetical protein
MYCVGFSLQEKWQIIKQKIFKKVNGKTQNAGTMALI